MAWHASLTALRDALAQLCPRRDESELILDEAGIPRERVPFSDQADVTWHEILRAADRLSRLPALLDVALRRYPGTPDLVKAVGAVRGDTPQDVSSNAPPNIQSDNP